MRHVVVEANGELYLAAGGSDFLAELDKETVGTTHWLSDTLGSAQAVAVMGGQLVIGGHFRRSPTTRRRVAERRLGVDSLSRPQRRVPDQKGHSRLLV